MQVLHITLSNGAKLEFLCDNKEQGIKLLKSVRDIRSYEFNPL